VPLETIENDADTRLDYEEWIEINQKHEQVGDAEKYTAGQKAFLDKYLNQVLFDTGFLTLSDN